MDLEVRLFCQRLEIYSDIQITNLENFSSWRFAEHKNKPGGQKRLRNTGFEKRFILRLDIQDWCQALLLNKYDFYIFKNKNRKNNYFRAFILE